MTVALPDTSADAATAARSVPPEALSDTVLIRRIAAGDRLAMRLFAVRHQAPLYRWLLCQVHDQTLAEDLLSKVFLEVWRRAASFDAGTAPSNRLLAIAREQAIAISRGRGASASDAGQDDGLGAVDRDPALRSDRTARLRQALTRLPPEHREVLDLVYYHRKSIDEVAEIIGIPVTAVTARLREARKALADLGAATDAPVAG